jgi:hypothetical protein
MAQRRAQPGNEPPILLVKWYDVTKWLLERVDSFPKSQRFIFGQRIADRALNILEAVYSSRKADLLAGGNRTLIKAIAKGHRWQASSNRESMPASKTWPRTSACHVGADKRRRAATAPTSAGCSA